jgi:hypothetical protein
MCGIERERLSHSLASASTLRRSGRARESWAEIWHQIGPIVERVLTRGEAAGGEYELLYIDCSGYSEKVFARSPI